MTSPPERRRLISGVIGVLTNAGGDPLMGFNVLLVKVESVDEAVAAFRKGAQAVEIDGKVIRREDVE